MITNLPTVITVELLEKFNFGHSDAISDEISSYRQGLAEIPAFNLFLSKQTILARGDRGSGKSALYKAIVNGDLQLPKIGKFKNSVIGINDEYQYLNLKEVVEEKIEVKKNSPKYLYNALWEIYVLYIILNFISINYSSYPGLETVFKLMKPFLETHKPSTIIEFLSKITQQLGFSFSSKLALPLLTFDIGIDTKNANTKLDTKFRLSNVLSIPDLKYDLNEYLKERNVNLTVIFDGLDKITDEDEYEIQQYFVHGLINCLMSYTKYSNINVKALIRNDLYYKALDFGIQSDKLRPITAELTWTKKDIKQFIAKRIIYNYFNLFNTNLIIDIEDDAPVTIDNYLDDSSDGDNAQEVEYRHEIDDDENNLISLSEKVNEIIIYSMFPKIVNHFDIKGTGKTMSFDEFLETHLTIRKSGLNPRLIIEFLQNCIRCSLSKFKENYETEITPNDKNEYPIVLKKGISQAYSKLQEDIIDDTKNIAKNYSTELTNLFESRHRRAKFQNAFTYSFLANTINLENNKERVLSFIKFMIRIGVLIDRSPEEQNYTQKRYELPILLKKNFGKHID